MSGVIHSAAWALARMIERAGEAAKLPCPVHVHMLRHSTGYALAGSTLFDANLTALKSLEAEWSRTDVTYDDKVAHLNGTTTGGKNGAYLLNTSTVFTDNKKDTVIGNPDVNALDLFFVTLTGKKKDKLYDVASGAFSVDGEDSTGADEPIGARVSAWVAVGWSLVEQWQK